MLLFCGAIDRDLQGQIELKSQNLPPFWACPRDKSHNWLKSGFLNLDPKSTLLTPKHRETHGCVVSTVATDALVLKHQAISIHNAD